MMSAHTSRYLMMSAASTACKMQSSHASAVHGKWRRLSRSVLSGGLCAYAEVVGAIIAGAVAMPLYGGHAMYLDKALPWGELPESFRILVACMCAHLAETLLPAVAENHRSTPEVSCPPTLLSVDTRGSSQWELSAA